MKNPVIDNLFTRQSVRQFQNRPIESEDKRLILESAAQAPTAGNQMLYTILDITDPALKKQLAESCDHQPFIAQAPLVLIFLADCARWYDAYDFAGCNPRSPGCGDLLLAAADACIAAQNAVTAAWSLGIGSCYIGDILENVEQHREMLGLSNFLMPAAMVVFGYPAGQQSEQRKVKRFSLDYIVRENRYQPLTQDEQRAMFRLRAADPQSFDFDAYLRKFCDRKYASDFSKEMSRSAQIYPQTFMNS